ncbi:MAG: T9SS type A sorting domain-containing protein [Flavobacteriia bacterium]|jgi:hypothetical protein
MKKPISILFLLTTLLVAGQNFGDFASAVYIKNCTTTQFYNTTGTGVNCINTTCTTVFQGTNFGSFNQNSNGLSLLGGEIKTFKNAGANVCGGNLNYTVYLTGSRPGSPTFTQINLGFFSNCCTTSFCVGGGPCGGNDQKWQTTNHNFDLTNRAAGNYTLEIYYDYSGNYGATSGCPDTRYINNGGSSTNYTATFQIVASGGSCALLPVDLLNFSGVCENNTTNINWSTASETNSSHFTIEKSYDGEVWDSLARFNAEGFSTKNKEYQFEDSSRNIINTSYYRLRQYDFDGQMRFDQILPLICDSKENLFYTFPNPSNSDFQLIVQRNKQIGNYILTISDINGKEIFQSEIEVKKGINIIPLMEKLNAGIYLISITNEEQQSETIKHIVY